jgi:hypothetical protein
MFSTRRKQSTDRIQTGNKPNRTNIHPPDHFLTRKAGSMASGSQITNKENTEPFILTSQALNSGDKQNIFIDS